MDEETKYYSLVKKVFDILAPFYDLVALPIAGERTRVVDITNVKNDSKILDVATGTGKQAFAFANRGDVSCVSFALHDMPLTIRKRVLKEMVRVTKLNGTMVIVDYALPENKIGRFLIYHLVSTYEGEYYRKFIISDLEELLREIGIEIKVRLPILLGAGKILTGIKL